MAKYLKHYYVDGANLTEYFTDKNMGPNGKTHPRIDGLDVKLWFVDDNGIDYCLSVIPDETSVTEVLGLDVMTLVEWSADAGSQFYARKTEILASPELLATLDKTEAEVQAMMFDGESVETILASFAQFSPPVAQPTE
jgi:hypothetical protein